MSSSSLHSMWEGEGKSLAEEEQERSAHQQRKRSEGRGQKVT